MIIFFIVTLNRQNCGINSSANIFSRKHEYLNENRVQLHSKQYHFPLVFACRELNEISTHSLCFVPVNQHKQVMYKIHICDLHLDSDCHALYNQENTNKNRKQWH